MAVLLAASVLWPMTAAAQAPAAQPAPAQPVQARTTMAGAWRLNPDLSRNPRQGRGGDNGGEMGGRRGRFGGGMGGGYGGGDGGGMGGGYGGGYGGGMRGGFGGGMGGRRMNPDAMRARMQLMREIMQPQKRFTLTLIHDDKTVSFTYPDGQVYDYQADGKKEKHQFNDGTVESKTKWDHKKLVTEYDLGDGFKIVRTYELSSDGLHLDVSTKMEGGRMRRNREMKAVYDIDQG